METLPPEVTYHLYSFFDELALYEMSVVDRAAREFIFSPDSDSLWKGVCPYPIKPTSIPTWQLWCVRCRYQTDNVLLSDMNRVMEANSYLGRLQTFTNWKTPISWVAMTSGVGWFYMKLRNTYLVSQDWGALVKQTTSATLVGATASLSLVKVETSMTKNLDAIIESRDYERFLPENLWLQRKTPGANITASPLASQLELRIFAYIESDPIKCYYASWASEEAASEDTVGQLKAAIGEYAVKWHKAHLLLQLVHNMSSSAPSDVALHFTNLSFTALKECCDVFETLQDDLELLLSEESSLSPEQKLWSVLEMQKIHASVSKRDQFNYPLDGLNDDATYQNISDLIAIHGDQLYSQWNVIASQKAKISTLKACLGVLERALPEDKHRGVLALYDAVIVEQNGIKSFCHAVETPAGEILELTSEAIAEYGIDLQDNHLMMTGRYVQVTAKLRSEYNEMLFSDCPDTRDMLNELIHAQAEGTTRFIGLSNQHAVNMLGSGKLTHEEGSQLVRFITALSGINVDGDKALEEYSFKKICEPTAV